MREGTIFHDKYEVQEILESTPDQTSILAKDIHHEELVVIKEMKISFETPGDRIGMSRKFKNKAGDLSRFYHRGLPRINDCFIEVDETGSNAVFYIIRNFIQGKSLANLMHEWQGKPFPVKASENYFLQLIEIIDYLHNENPFVLCGNLKPSSIIIQDPSESTNPADNSEYGNIYIINAGFGEIFKSGEYNFIKGLGGFTAPEQDGKGISKNTDLYSLGAIMYYILTGVNPADYSKSGRFLKEIIEMNPEVPEYLNSLVMSMLDIYPENRPASARSIKKILKNAMGRIRGKSRLGLKRVLEVPSGETDIKEEEVAKPKRTSFMSTPLNVKPPEIELPPTKVNPKKVEPPPPAKKEPHHKVEPPTPTFERIPTLEDRPGGAFKGRIISQKTIKEPYRNIKSGAALQELTMLQKFKENHHLSMFAAPFVILALILIVMVFFFPETLEGILKKANPILHEDSEKSGIPLHEAAFKGNYKLIESLIDEGEDVDRTDEYGFTALHKAAKKGRLDAVKILLEKGAFVDSRNNFNTTPLQLAAKEGHKDVVIWLIQHGANVHAADQAQRTALSLAKKYKHHDVVTVLENYNKYIRLDPSGK